MILRIEREGSVEFGVWSWEFGVLSWEFGVERRKVRGRRSEVWMKNQSVYPLQEV